jgi:hypothetical protein
MDIPTLVHRRLMGFIIGFAWLASLPATPVAAQVKRGDFTSPENASKLKKLVGPRVTTALNRG